MSFSPNIFMANMKSKGGPARPSRFELILPIPPYISQFIENGILSRIANFPINAPILITDMITQALSGNGISLDTTGTEITRYLALQCESTELPGKSLQTADVKIYGPTFKVPYQTAYQEITFNFICTNEFFERKLFDRWLEAIMPTDTNNLRFAKGNRMLMSGKGSTRYLTTPKIVQYNELVKQIYAVELIDAFPISIASQPLAWSDDGLHRLSVQFTYQKYRTIYDGNVNVESVLSALFGTYASRLQDQAGRSVSDALSRIF
jgi:hypothetical protein